MATYHFTEGPEVAEARMELITALSKCLGTTMTTTSFSLPGTPKQQVLFLNAQGTTRADPDLLNVQSLIDNSTSGKLLVILLNDKAHSSGLTSTWASQQTRLVPFFKNSKIVVVSIPEVEDLNDAKVTSTKIKAATSM